MNKTYKKSFNNKGFTLLEILVVLILLSLILTMVFQIFSFILNINERSAQLQIKQKQQQLQISWFRKSSSALHPDNIDYPTPFIGNRSEFKGISLAALDKPIGVPTIIKWKIINYHNKNILRYYFNENKDVFWDIMIWEKGEGKFLYKASNNRWYETWPPNKFGKEEKQLPNALLFTCLCDKKPITIVANINGHKEPQHNFKLAFDL